MRRFVSWENPLTMNLLRFPFTFQENASPEDPESSSEEVASILGPQTRFRGEVVGKGNLKVKGRFEGALRLQGDFHVEEGASVHAEMGTRDAVFQGQVSGSLSSDGRVQIHHRGSFRGQLLAGRLQVHDGAVLHGKVRVPDSSSKTRKS